MKTLGSELAIKVKVKRFKKIIVDHVAKLKNERSTTGFRFNPEELIITPNPNQ